VAKKHYPKALPPRHQGTKIIFLLCLNAFVVKKHCQKALPLRHKDNLFISLCLSAYYVKSQEIIKNG